jgi:phospholipid/cholesterol/gamma-HCH transport system permease protein
LKLANLPFAGRFSENLSEPLNLKSFFVNAFTWGIVLYCWSPLLIHIGLVFTLQSRPTLLEFGAVSWMPSMVSISIIREIGPIITALICAGRIGSVYAELGSMRVTEQIDAMEVSGTNPFKYLVVTRIMATTLMLPILVFWDAIALWIVLVENIKGHVSFLLYFNQVFNALDFGDDQPQSKFLLGFAIGLVVLKDIIAKGTAGLVWLLILQWFIPPCSSLLLILSLFLLTIL